MICSAHALIYSVSAARRIWQVPVGVRVRVVRFWRCVWLHIAGQRPRFVSLQLFKQHFAQRRMEAATRLGIEGNDGDENFIVSNPDNASSYFVFIGSSGPVCSCEDYSNQQRFFAGKGICKHGYRALQALGYGSLSSYLLSKEKV